MPYPASEKRFKKNAYGKPNIEKAELWQAITSMQEELVAPIMMVVTLGVMPLIEKTLSLQSIV